MTALTESVGRRATVTECRVVEDVVVVLPPYVAVTGSGLLLWLTLAMVQLACPAALVVPVQLCAELPEPMVNVTVCPLTGVPAVGSLVVSTPVERGRACRWSASWVPV